MQNFDVIVRQACETEKKYPMHQHFNTSSINGLA